MSERTIKVLSYNIHKGFSLGRKYVLENIRLAIRSTGADLVFLQEVLGRHDRLKKRIPSWPRQSQFEYLADKIWSHYAYGENAVYSSGHHGNAILSKFPFSSSRNIDISMSRFAKRGLLHATVKVPGFRRLMHVICLHLDLRNADRMLQAELVADHINAHVPKNNPLIIAGDFNDWQQKMTKHFESNLNLEEVFMKKYRRHARTYPSQAPALKLDRVYYRNMVVKEAQCFSKKPWKKLSDHLAIYSELSLNG